MNKKEFIESIAQGAVMGQARYSILASVTIAQAILESGWGHSGLSQKAKNLFGIKAGSSWKGKKIAMATTEWYNGNKTVVTAEFRAYDSFVESIDDHNKLLLNARYSSVRQCEHYKEACRQLYKCGYATDPAYAEKLINLIQEYKLYEFDCQNAKTEAAMGIEDNKIQNLQQLCNRLGIRDDEGKALIEDNLLGPRTESCINRLPLLKEGSKGAAVEFLQKLLCISPSDGIFGPITEKGVLQYQKKHGLEEDGVVGTETWKLLIEKQ